MKVERPSLMHGVVDQRAVSNAPSTYQERSASGAAGTSNVTLAGATFHASEQTWESNRARAARKRLRRAWFLSWAALLAMAWTAWMLDGSGAARKSSTMASPSALETLLARENVWFEHLSRDAGFVLQEMRRSDSLKELSGKSGVGSAGRASQSTPAVEGPLWSGTMERLSQVPPPSVAPIRVAGLSQFPQFPAGCEVTALSMLLDFARHPVSTQTLASEMTYDPTPETFDSRNQIIRWGDPNVGFVGSMTRAGYGFGVNHAPVYALLHKVWPGHALDLSGRSFSAVEQVLASRRPVVVWTTLQFAPTDQWITWTSPEGTIHATMEEHAVLLVGYDASHVYVNDPNDGSAAKPVAWSTFLASWVQMGSQAVTVTATNATGQ